MYLITLGKKKINLREQIIFKDADKIIDKINVKRFRNKTVLITGANGLFGQNLVATFVLANKKYNTNIKIITISKSGPNSFIKKFNKKKNNLKINLEKKFNLKTKINYIFHCAGYARPKKWMSNKLSTINLNVFGTQQLLEIAKKNKAKLIFFSTLDVYGYVSKNNLPVKEDYKGLIECSNKSNAYGEAKRIGENLCSIYRYEKKLKVYIARIFHTYGPGIYLKDERVIADFIRGAIKKGNIKLMDKGKNIKHFCYTIDAISMIINIITNGKSFVYNIAGNRICSIYDLANTIAKITNSKITKPKNNSGAEFVKNLNTEIYASTKKYTNEFGKFKYENFDSSLKKIINWMININKY